MPKQEHDGLQFEDVEPAYAEKKGEKLKTMKSFRFLEDGDDLRII